MTLCEHCHLPGTDHDPSLQECLAAQSAAMKKLLSLIGDKAACAGCGAEIYWVHHRSGKRAPYTPAGLNHFIDCPKAANFGTR